MLEPAMESAEGSISAAAMGFLNYFVDTYVGKMKRNGGRYAPKVKPGNWSQFDSVMEGHPHTTNSVEAWNMVFNNTNPHTKSMWTTVNNFRRKEEMARTKWRQLILARDHEEQADPVGTRQKAVRKKLDVLKGVMVKYYEFEGHEGVSEYLKLISAILS